MVSTDYLGTWHMRTLNKIFIWSDHPVIGGDIVDALVPAGSGPLILMYSQSTSGSTEPGERPVTARSGNRAALHHDACGHCKGSVVCVYVTVCCLRLAAWRSGWRSSSMYEVNAHRVRLQLGWVTVFGRVYHLGL